MALAQSSKRRVTFKRESAWGTPADGSSGGQVVRRTNTTLGLTKETYQSAEKRVDFQRVDSRHGMRRVQGGITGELYVGAWEDFFESLVRRDFTGVSTITASSGDGFTVASNVLTRAAGGAQSFLTDGLRVGMVVRLTNTISGNMNRNILVTAVTATTATLFPLDGQSLTDVGVADTDAAIVIPGKVTYMPLTGHTSDSYTVEDYESGIDTAEVYDGVMIGGAGIQLPAAGIATIDWNNMLGRDQTLYSAGTAPYFVSPTAAGVQRALAAVPGYLRLNGELVAVVTGLTLNVDNGLEAPAVAFSNTTPQVFYGPAAVVTGQLSAFVEDQALLTALRDEQELELSFILEAPGSAPRSFLNFYAPRVKINSASRDDPDRGIIQTVDFECLRKETATGYLETTLFIQDSSLA